MILDLPSTLQNANVRLCSPQFLNFLLQVNLVPICIALILLNLSLAFLNVSFAFLILLFAIFNLLLILVNLALQSINLDLLMLHLFAKLIDLILQFRVLRFVLLLLALHCQLLFDPLEFGLEILDALQLILVLVLFFRPGTFGVLDLLFELAILVSRVNPHLLFNFLRDLFVPVKVVLLHHKSFVLRCDLLVHDSFGLSQLDLLLLDGGNGTLLLDQVGRCSLGFFD